MSYSHTQRKKNKKRTRTDEEKSVAQRIRNGQMPRQFFAKSDDSHLQRHEKTGYLTWDMKSTYHELTKKEEL